MLGNHPNIAIRIITLLSSVQFSKNMLRLYDAIELCMISPLHARSYYIIIPAEFDYNRYVMVFPQN